MKRKAPYFPLFVSDILGSNKVAAMNTTEFGAYCFLLCRAWTEDEAATVPDDDALLAGWTRMSPGDWARAKPRVLAPWKLLENGRWMNPRLREEYDGMKRSARLRSEAGRAGAGVRWQTDGKGMANAWPGHTEFRDQIADDRGKAKVTPPPPTTAETRTPLGVTDPYPEVRANPEQVRDCWNAYPSAGRVGFQRARLAIAGALDVLRLRGETDPAAWLQGRVRAFAASPAGNAGKFTPHAATWFADGRYDDDPAGWERSAPATPDGPAPMTPEKLNAILEGKA